MILVSFDKFDTLNFFRSNTITCVPILEAWFELPLWDDIPWLLTIYSKNNKKNIYSLPVLNFVHYPQ